jgi:hypothetical protein
MTINEVRASNGLEPLEKGGDIILNQTYITAMSMGEGEQEPEEQEPEEGAGFEGEDMEGEGDGFEPVTKARRVRVSVEL